MPLPETLQEVCCMAALSPCSLVMPKHSLYAWKADIVSIYRKCDGREFSRPPVDVEDETYAVKLDEIPSLHAITVAPIISLPAKETEE